MRLLIGYESSGTVRRAFRRAGHEAWSCDLLPAADGSPYHIQGDVFEALARGGWEGGGFHPPCTFVSGSGLHWNDRGRGWDKTLAALDEFVRLLVTVDFPCYIENPVGIISTWVTPPDQFFQPYEFGEDASKKTCLWLLGLPRLAPTKRFPGRWVNGVERWGNQTDSGQNRLGPSDDRWSVRSKTYEGVADAMAAQWFQ